MIPYDQIRAIHIEASSHCNAACPVCPRNYHGGQAFPYYEKKHLTLAEHQRFFPEELARRQQLILYCGNYGDPAMNPELVEICQWWLSQNPNITIQINTNAGMRDADFWAQLGRTLVGNHSNVTFSVDGLEDTNHIYRRNVEWKKVRTAMKAFIGAGGNAVWEFLVFKHNQHQVDEARALAQQWGFQAFHAKKAMGFAGIGNSAAIPVLKRDGELDYHIFPTDDPGHLNRASMQERDPQKLLVPSPDYRNSFSHETGSSALTLLPETEARLNSCTIDCMAKRDHNLYVSAEGLVYPCCFIGSRQYAQDRWNFTNSQIKKFLGSVGKQRYSLHERSLQEVIEDPWFNHAFEITWSIPTVRQGKLAICADFCSSGVTEVKEATAHRAKT